MKVLALLALLFASASALSLSAPVAARPALARRPSLARMAEGAPEAEAPAAEPAPAAEAEKPLEFRAAASAEPAKQEFDLSQYSITLSIFFLFVVVKTLAYFGIGPND